MKNILAQVILFLARVLTERDKRPFPRPVPYRGNFYSEDYATKARLHYGDDQY